MPELPEVETIVRELDRTVTGKKLSRLLIFDKERLRKSPRLRLPREISAVHRHGKYIVCEVAGGLRCLMHLRMTGELLFENAGKGSQSQKNERAKFLFSDGSSLRFIDTRRFGTIEWLSKRKLLPLLGPDPLSRSFTPLVLARSLRNSSRAIKSFLLDQHLVAGIGNIYGDEALWMAKIHPKRRSHTLTAKETVQLVHSIKQVLREAISMGGFTLRDYKRIDGSSGYYQNSRKVYDREGGPCLRCRAKIKRIKVGGRSSYLCPACQR